MDLNAFGHFLREAREQRELSLDDAVKTLKIQRRILESFEEGNFSAGGSPVQVRGMLRNYARFLRLEEDVVLQHYETAILPPKTGRWRKATDETQAIRPATQPRRDTLTIPLSGGGRRSGGPRFAWVGQLLTTLVGVALLGVIVFFVGQILDRTPVEDSQQPTLAVAVETLDPTLATATYTATWTPISLQPTLTPIVAIGQNGFSVELSFVQRSWVQVVGDGTEQFAGIARPDETQSYTFDEDAEIHVANAAALVLSIDGQEQPPFGERGQQVMILINSTGLQVLHPGATPTLDASRIITITETPVPTLTPLFEPTSTLEPTPIGAEIVPTETPPSTDAVQAAEVVPTETPTTASTSTPNAATLGLDPNLPTLTPFSFMVEGQASATVPALNADVTSAPTTPTIQAENVEVASPAPTLTSFDLASDANPAPTQASAVQNQATPSQTARPAATATTTPTLTATSTSTHNVPTAIVPLRVTQSGLPTRKAP